MQHVSQMKVVLVALAGEGYHNVAGRKDHSLYCSPEYLDAHLTEFGWQQVRGLALPQQLQRVQQGWPFQQGQQACMKETHRAPQRQLLPRTEQAASRTLLS